jgi:hypothetical protein
MPQLRSLSGWNETRVAAGGLRLCGCSECQVEGLVGAERRSLGVGQAGLLITQAGAQLAEAFLAVARFGILPRFPVRSRKACATPWSIPARYQCPASAARQARPRLA